MTLGRKRTCSNLDEITLRRKRRLNETMLRKAIKELCI